MMKKNKQYTINDLAGMMQDNKASLKSLESQIADTKKTLGTKIDSVEERLAMMTQKQFLENQEHMNKQFASVDKQFTSVDKQFASVDKRFDEVNSKIDNLETTVKIQKVNIFDHKDLEHRVEKLEEVSNMSC